MPVPVLYPKVSLEMQSGRIARWLAGDGQTVTAGQVIFEIENDKAAVEVESPASGQLRHIVSEGAEVDVGAEVAQVLSAAEAGASARPSPVMANPANIPAPSAVQPTTQPHKQRGAPSMASSRLPNPTPLARRIAKETGIDLSGMAGTGPRGRVQKTDVMAHLESIAAGATPVVSGEFLNAVWLRRGQGMPVVLLHGFSGELNSWRGLLAGARTEFPVLALDLPAHGASPRAVPADLDALCAAVEATLNQLVTGPVVLAGHSLGAAVAVRLAARARLDVRGLCLFAPAGLGPEIDEAFTHGIVRAQSAVSLRPWLERLVHDPAVITDAFVGTVAAQRQDTGLTSAMTGFASRFFPDGTQAHNILGDLAGLRQPVRVIFGKQDRILPFATTHDLPASVGLHAVDACGHMPQLEHPDLSLRLLSEVWRSAI